jgi:hypothetical protein
LLMVNMSVWTSLEALFDFAYKSAHKNVMATRRQWFKGRQDAYQVLWWIAAQPKKRTWNAVARERHQRGASFEYDVE